MVAMQFSFSNARAVPRWIGAEERESPEESKGRKNRSTGKLVIEPVEGCSLMRFVEDIEKAGYTLVDAFSQKRLQKGQVENTYQMVRFVFVRNDFLKSPNSFASVRALALASLNEMCKSALWRIRAFLNPYYDHGEKVPGEYFVGINLEARQPLRLLDGRPVTMWQKDERGMRIGDAPLPLQPSHWLRIQNEEICLVAN